MSVIKPLFVRFEKLVFRGLPKPLKIENIKNVDEEYKKTDKKNKNILLLALSTFTYGELNTSYFKYEGQDHPEEYVYQLEPVPEMLLEKFRDENNGEKLDEIIVLSTDQGTNPVEKVWNKDRRKFRLVSESGSKVSPYQFFKYRIKTYIDQKIKDSSDDKYPLDFKLIEIKSTTQDNGVQEAISRILDEIRSDKNKDAQLYIDMHGGPRDQQDLLTSVISLLQFEDSANSKRLKPENVFNVAYNNSKRTSTIQRARDTITIQNFVSGIHEVINYARTESLEEFIRMKKDWNLNGYESRLINAMKGLAQSIQLMDLSNFQTQENILYDLLQPDQFDNYKDNANEASYIFMFIDSIKQSYRELFENGRSTPNEIRWCMKKGFYQQALTLIESKMPYYYMDHNFIKYSQGIYESLPKSNPYKICIKDTHNGGYNEYYKYSEIFEPSPDIDEEEALKREKEKEKYANWAFNSKVNWMIQRDVDPYDKDLRSNIVKFKSKLDNYENKSDIESIKLKQIGKIRISKDIDDLSNTEENIYSAFYLENDDLYELILYHSCLKVLRNIANHGETIENLVEKVDVKDMVDDYLKIVKRLDRSDDESSMMKVMTIQEFMNWLSENPIPTIAGKVHLEKNAEPQVAVEDYIYKTSEAKNNNSKDTKPKAGHTYVNVDIVERNKEDLLSRQNHWILLNNVKVRKNKNSWKLRADSWSPIDS